MPNDPTNNHELLFATADRTLLAPYGLDAGGIDRVFGQIMTHSVDYADLYFQYSRSEGWSLEEGMVKSGSFNIDQGVGVRAVSGEKTAFAYSDDISLPALESAARATRSMTCARWYVNWGSSTAASSPDACPTRRSSACSRPPTCA